jgi:hypothetical protein
MNVKQAACENCAGSGVIGDEMCRVCDGKRVNQDEYSCGHLVIKGAIFCPLCYDEGLTKSRLRYRDETDLCEHYFYKGIDCLTCIAIKEKEEFCAGIALNDVPNPKLIKDESFDPVNRPSHYNQYKIEPIKVVEDWKLGFHLGNAVKYISRSPFKGCEKQDLKKAIWNIQRYIDEVISEEPLD